MTFHIITLFPQIFENVFSQSIIARALKNGLLKIDFINPRDFTKDKYKTVDDKPYGGGPGMILKVDILVKALESVTPQSESSQRKDKKPYSILLSASGKKYNQKIAQKLATQENVVLICGHYEGVDARVEKFVDEVISIGDYILSGGETAAIAIVDSTTRLIPDAINPKSLQTESFSETGNYIEYPQYTRPENFRGLKVPRVLISGNHFKIKKWRQNQSAKLAKKLEN